MAQRNGARMKLRCEQGSVQKRAALGEGTIWQDLGIEEVTSGTLQGASA